METKVTGIDSKLDKHIDNQRADFDKVFIKLDGLSGKFASKWVEKAMITLLAYSAIRNRSFCNIKLRDIDFGENTLRVRKVKGRKEYISNISSDCVRILLSYLQEYPRKLDDFLFTTKVRSNQYQTSDIRKFVKVLGRRAKIEKKIYPHLLRHSLASNMLNRGANIILIKEQLGHDWIQSTENYLTCFPSRIKSEFEIYKPSYI